MIINSQTKYLHFIFTHILSLKLFFTCIKYFHYKLLKYIYIIEKVLHEEKNVFILCKIRCSSQLY